MPKKHVGSVFSAEHFKVNFSRDPRVNSADSESRIEVSGRRWHMDMALPHLGKSHAQIAQSALLGAQPRDDLFDCYRYSLISDLHHYIPHWRHLRNRLAFTFCKAIFCAVRARNLCPSIARRLAFSPQPQPRLILVDIRHHDCLEASIVCNIAISLIAPRKRRIVGASWCKRLISSAGHRGVGRRVVKPKFSHSYR